MNEVMKRKEFEKCKTSADRIVFSMKYQKEDWVKDDYHITNAKNNISFWTANGFDHFRICDNHPENIKIPFFTRLKLWKSYKKYLVPKKKKAEEVLTVWKY